MENIETVHEDRKKIINFINEKKCFWLMELRTHLGERKSGAKNTTIATRIQDVITFLKKRGRIQCYEKKGCERQYVVVNEKEIINIDDFEYSQTLGIKKKLCLLCKEKLEYKKQEIINNKYGEYCYCNKCNCFQKIHEI